MHLMWTLYQLYKNRCESSCPIYSSRCVNYEDIIPYSSYVAKGFYDLNVKIENINFFYDTYPSSNYVTGQNFPVLREFISLECWIILSHGQSNNLIIKNGQSYSGAFSYKIGFVSSSFQGSFVNLEEDQIKLVIIIQKILVFIFLHLKNFHDNKLKQEFKRQATILICQMDFLQYQMSSFLSKLLQFKCIQYLVVGYKSSNCRTNQFLLFDEQTQTYSCKFCDQSGCNKCVSVEDCIECTYTF
ncbi:unnamed protein product [Paramecium sonneborni]|uniref:Uncharacterized protein n=1 Tax=Paramecium sonneborni TaxID=65129 RepID=A0A8S1QBS8_9CILI|nr:unnamed protein product [Paramecium sonneborni]